MSERLEKAKEAWRQAKTVAPGGMEGNFREAINLVLELLEGETSDDG